MNSKVTIKFNSPAISGDLLKIQDNFTPSVSISIFFESLSLGNISIPPSGDINQDISNVKTFLENTYNSTNRYIISENYVNKEIEILDNIGKSVFSEISNNTSGRLVATIDNEQVQLPVVIDAITLIENQTNACTLVDIQIQTQNQVSEITSPVVQPVTTNPFTITNISRDSLHNILISVNDGVNSDSESIFVPILSPSIFNLEVVNTPNGSTVYVFQEQDAYYSIQYSLDNVAFYDSSSFSGLSVGNYTMYIRDSIGCDTSIPFEVTGFEYNVFKKEPYFNVSEQNSIITVLREDINNETIFKNPTNTLSYEESSKINGRNFKQVYQKKDGIVRQQYRSNYDNTTIKLIDCSGNESVIVSEKKSDNFEITDVRDVKILSVDYLGGSFVGIQYGVGNTYDPNTLVVNGSYNLGSIIPSFMNVDDYINIEGAGWVKVVSVSYYDGIETLVLDYLANSFPVTPVGQTLKGTSIYNKLEYELYEFSFDCNNLSGDYYITYSATDNEFDDVNHKTEWFNISDYHLNTYLLKYCNSENNETNYSTGIINKIRIPYVNTLTYLPNDTQDVYLTDTNAVNIESTYRDLYSLNVIPIPMGFVRKIGLALSNDRLSLNGLSLLKNSELETERIGMNNLYNLTVQFIRSDYAFTNIVDDGSIVLPSGNPLADNGDGTGILLAN